LSQFLVRKEEKYIMRTSCDSVYHWGIGTPRPARDLQSSQTVASTPSLLCGCERRSFRTVIVVQLPTESDMRCVQTVYLKLMIFWKVW